MALIQINIPDDTNDQLAHYSIDHKCTKKTSIIQILEAYFGGKHK